MKHYYPPGVWPVLGIGEEYVVEGVLVPDILCSVYMTTLILIWVATVHYCVLINFTRTTVLHQLCQLEITHKRYIHVHAVCMCILLPTV